MMRVTIKATFDVEGVSSVGSCRLNLTQETTVGQLKSEVLDRFHWEGVFDAGDIILSLNKKDELGLEDEALADCGICNGDVVWVLPPEGHERVRPISKKPKASVESKGSTVSSVGRGVGELKNCLELEKERVGGSILQAVVCLLHRACLESGLDPRPGMDELPTILNDGESTYWLAYNIPESSFLPRLLETDISPSEASLKMKCLYLGEHVMICSFIQTAGADGAYNTTFGASATIRIPLYFRKSPESVFLVAKKELVMDLKSKACAPSMLSGAHVLGRSLRLSMTSLPEEITIHILTKLELQDVLSVSMTCRSLNSLASSDFIWEHLYSQTFQGNIRDRGNEGFRAKDVFKAEWEKRKKDRKDRVFDRPFFVDRPCIYPHRPSVFVPPLFPPHPGVNGGDADRLPFAPPNFGPSIFGDRRRPQSGFPRYPNWRLR